MHVAESPWLHPSLSVSQTPRAFRCPSFSPRHLRIPPKVMRPHSLSLPPQRAEARVLRRNLLTLVALNTQCGSCHTDADGEYGVGESAVRLSAVR